MRYIINKIIKSLLKIKYNKFIKYSFNISKKQEEILLSIIAKNCNSEYGKKHIFSDIKTIAEYQKTVPIVDYEDIETYILEMVSGKNEVLFSEKLTLIEETSGSTTNKKYIPYTSSLQKEYNKGIYTWLYDLLQSYNFLNGSLYFSITPKVKDNKNSSIIGFNDESEYIGIVGKIIKNFFAVPNDVKFIEDEEKFKIVTCIFLFGRCDLSLISIWNASFLLNLLKCFESNQQIILNSIKERKILVDIDEKLKNKLNSYLVINDERYDELTEVIDKYKYDYEKIFSNLKVISSWGDSDSVYMYDKLKKIFPNTYVQKKGILATEGVISIPFCNTEGHVITYLSHFYEFEDFETGEVCLIQELRENKRYKVIITTSGGLYRYRLGDIIEIKGYYNQIPIIKLIGRDKISDYVRRKNK